MDSLLMERLLLLLTRGRVTSTYKYAVLLALLDLCVEGVARGAAPSTLTTRQIAERLLLLYWPQVRPHPGAQPAGSGVLLQSSTRHAAERSQARMLQRILEFQEHQKPGARLDQLLRRPAPPMERLLRELEWIAIDKPLPRLQVLDGQVLPFLYTLSWTRDEGGRPVQRGLPVLQYSAFKRGDYDNTLRLLPDVAERLAALAPALRPLIQQLWADEVSRMNGLEQHSLRDWLFEQSRISLEPVREPLWAAQDRRCFFCEQPVSVARAHVDHLLAWSRCGEDALDNLVVADPECNSSKRDLLVGPEVLRRWRARPEPLLDEIAAQADWVRQPARVQQTAQVLYRRAAEQTPLWEDRGKLLVLEAPLRRRLLEVLEA